MLCKRSVMDGGEGDRHFAHIEKFVKYDVDPTGVNLTKHTHMKLAEIDHGSSRLGELAANRLYGKGKSETFFVLPTTREQSQAPR